MAATASRKPSGFQQASLAALTALAAFSLAGTPSSLAGTPSALPATTSARSGGGGAPPAAARLAREILLKRSAVKRLLAPAADYKEATALALMEFETRARDLGVDEKVLLWRQLGGRIERAYKVWLSEGPLTVRSAEELDGLTTESRPEWHSPARVFHGRSGYGMAIRESDGQVFVGFLKTQFDSSIQSNAVRRVDYGQLERLEEFNRRKRAGDNRTRPEFLASLAASQDRAWRPALETAAPKADRSRYTAKDRKGRETRIVLLADHLNYEWSTWGKAVAYQDGRRVGSLAYRVEGPGHLRIENPAFAPDRLGDGVELILVSAVIRGQYPRRLRQLYTQDGRDLNEYPQSRLRGLLLDQGP
jgi:hypothetical protein